VTGVTIPDSGNMDLDLDLGGETTSGAAAAAHAAPAPAAKPTAAAAPIFAPAPAVDSSHDAMSLDFSVPEVPELQAKPAAPVIEPSSFDLSDISLDLDVPTPAPAAAPAPVPVSGFGELGLPSVDDHGEDDPISRKLELAEEFRQIGDTDGARDLLNEVVAKSTGAVKSRAQSMLADLG
jgi:pilus assembly protein FimV